MPSNLLNVPHFQQELEYSCVAACVRMVLAHFGDLRSEADLRALLDTQPLKKAHSAVASMTSEYGNSLMGPAEGP